jgi:hypothetical protein
MSNLIDIPLPKQLLDDQETLLQTIKMMSERPIGSQDFPASQKLHRDLESINHKIADAVNGIYKEMIGENNEQ